MISHQWLKFRWKPQTPPAVSHQLTAPNFFSHLVLRYDGDLKPNNSLSLEEDEGFSDWTQRRERRRQQRLQELNQGGEEDEGEEEVTINKDTSVKTAQASITSPSCLQRQEHVEEDRNKMEMEMEMERRKEREEEAIRAERVRREKEREEEDKRKRDEVMTRRKEEIQRPNTEVRVPHGTTVMFESQTHRFSVD